MKERKDRGEDELHATRAAVQEGVVGGGVALVRASKKLIGLEGVKGITLTRFTGADVIRHPLVGRIIVAYERAVTAG